MEASFFGILKNLDPVGTSVLAAAALVTIWFALTKNLPGLVFLIALSAVLVGSTIGIVDDTAAMLRWLSIFALLLAGILIGRMKLSFGLLLFWGYVFLGFVFLLRSISVSWQVQKTVLLVLVALGITLAYSAVTFKAYKASLVAIAVAAAVYSVLSFLPLISYLNSASRYSGLSKGAPAFAAFLGALLPFAFWGLWQAERKLVRLTCGFGFLCGATALILSGQRAGLVAGLLSLVPLILMVARKRWKAAVGAALVLILAFLLIGVLLEQSSVQRKDFLAARYSIRYGLSGRELIWRTALTRIGEEPFLGRGIGATEIVNTYSYHNAYLDVWYNTGLLGLLLYIASQIYFLYRILYLSRRTKDPEIRSILALALGYMIGFAALSMVESKGAGASNINIILYLFMGVMVSSNSLLDGARAQATAEDYQTTLVPYPERGV